MNIEDQIRQCKNDIKTLEKELKRLEQPTFKVGDVVRFSDYYSDWVFLIVEHNGYIRLAVLKASTCKVGHLWGPDVRVLPENINEITKEELSRFYNVASIEKVESWVMK